MSFESVRYNLSVLEESAGTIRAEELYGLLSMVLEESLGFCHAVDSSSLSSDDKGDLALSVNYILADALKALQQNREGIDELSAQTRKELEETTSAAAKAHAEMETVCSQIKQCREEKDQLAKMCAEAEAKNAELLRIKAECDALSKRIEELNDSTLGQMEDHCRELKEEAASREAREKKLQAETAQLEADTAAADKSLAEAEEKKRDVNAKLESLKSTIQSTEQAASNIEVERKKCAEILASLKDKNSAIVEDAAQYATIFNAVNSVINDPFICKNLFSKDGASFKIQSDVSAIIPNSGKKIETWDEMEKWLNDMQQRIELLLSVLQEGMRQVAMQGEKLTTLID